MSDRPAGATVRLRPIVLYTLAVCTLCYGVSLAPGQTKPALEGLFDNLKEAVYEEGRGKVFGLAQEIGGLKDPRAIPTLIALIDADNSYWTVYGVGYFGLGPLTAVRYDDLHHGPWWRKWWEANNNRFPKEAQTLAIPDFPKTAHGKEFAASPPDPATIILEPTLDDLLARLKREAREGRDINIPRTAGWIAQFENPRAIPVLIELIEEDNTYQTVYGIGYFGLSPLTGVRYDKSHDGAWWRKWWEENKAKYAEQLSRKDEPPSGNLRVPKHLRPALDAEDVADIPAQDLRAGADEYKRYLLIGPRPQAQTPADGFRLLIVMPGGSGGPDFHPFVKRIYKHALSDRYVLAQLVAPEWSPSQAAKLVWPTKATSCPEMQFSTEEFVDAVIRDVEQKHKLDTRYIFTLTWSSSGPAAYAVSLDPSTRVTGSFIAMSVFKPKQLPPLKNAARHAYYILHSPQDFIPLRMAEQARDDLAKNKAAVQLATYKGGHGWRGDVYGNLRRGIRWLEEHCRSEGGEK